MMNFTLPARLRKMRKPHVAVVRLTGMIAAGGGFGRAALNDAGVAALLDRAFLRGKPVAVALSINSPGGSPTQSALIAARIRRLAAEADVPVHAFCEDVAGSGGYWLATAGDHIWVDDNSIVGSIGVISSSFGFQELIARHGIERRVHTAGESKSMLDPFVEEQPDDVARLKVLQEEIHENFKQQVRSRRAGKLTLPENEMFDGRIWVGRKAVEAGLADGVGHLVPKMKELYGDKVRFVLSAPRRSFFQRAGAPGVEEIAGALGDTLTERALFARYGL